MTAPHKINGEDMTDDTIDAVSKALRRAWQLGQTYWQQADSDSYKQQDKSDETRKKFEALISETVVLLSASKPAAPSDTQDDPLCSRDCKAKCAYCEDMERADKHDERAAFETWACTGDGNCDDHDLERRLSNVDAYLSSDVERDWLVWQARAALEARAASPQPVAQPASGDNP